MHPPWIILHFLLHMFVFMSRVSGDAGQKESGNLTTRFQRETLERERRLIPYMTYYVTQSPTSANDGTRNIFIPIATPRENILHLNAVPKISLANVHNVNAGQLEVLRKPAIGLSNPTLFVPPIQVGHYKASEDRITPQIYRVETGVTGSEIQNQVQLSRQRPSKVQPLQVIKLNAVPIEEKHDGSPLIKIVPILTKSVPEDRAPKLLTPSHLGYLKGKTETLIARPLWSHNDNSFQKTKDNEDYLSQTYQEDTIVVPALTATQGNTNAHTIAKIGLSTTTPSSSINANDGRFSKLDSNTDHVSIAHLSQVNHANANFKQEPSPNTALRYTGGKYVTRTPGQPQAYYAQKTNTGQSEELQESTPNQILKVPRLRVPQEEKIRFVASVTPVSVNNDVGNTQWKLAQEKGKTGKIYDQQPLRNIFSLLKETNKIPSNLTPENIDAGIQTLSFILERLQANYQHGHKIPSQASSNPDSQTADFTQDRQKAKKVHSFPEKSGTSTPGRPGIDYPIYSSIPQTNFDCSNQRYKGFFGDPDTNCQVWHYCDLNGGQASFLCPNGTIFSQVALTCDWWFNVKCASTSQLYVLNERLYKYILPFSPSFPEDYSGPVVDTYLTAKFKEMEVKSKLKALMFQTNTTTTTKPESTTEPPNERATELAEKYETTDLEEQ